MRVRSLLIMVLAWVAVAVFDEPTALAADWPPVVNLSRLEGTQGFTVRGAEIGDHSGAAVNCVGDVNDDGYDDVIIGSGAIDPPGSENAGRSYVIFGSRDGHFGTLDLRNLDGKNGFALSGVGLSDASGSSVSAAGDFNGDGIDDLMIGAPNAEPFYVGAVYIVFGRRSGFPADFLLGDIDASTGFKITGVNFGNRFGSALAHVGDLNADGVSDVIIGASKAGHNDPGEVYVVFGSRDLETASISVESLDGTNGFTLTNGPPASYLGQTAAAAGDFNGDGLDDLVTAGSGAAGATYVIFGSREPFPAKIDIISGDLDGSIGFSIHGTYANEGAGESVTGIGDWNSDGIDDIAIGADGRIDLVSIGKVYIVYGSRLPFPARFNLSSLDGTNGFVIVAPFADDQFSSKLSNLGDIDGDGFDDLGVGAFLADGEDPESGAAYVVFGGRTLPSAGAALPNVPRRVPLGVPDGRRSFVMWGFEENAWAGYDVTTAGDFDGDGFADIIVGASRRSPANRGGAGESYVIYGKPGLTCFDGTVNGGTGSPNDVLTVNGQSGNARRSVTIAADADVILTLRKPPMGGSGRFVVQAALGAGASSGGTPLPSLIGTTCSRFVLPNPTPPVIVLNNLGRRTLLGASTYFGTPLQDPPPAPVGVRLGPLAVGMSLTVQGIIVDPGATSPKQLSTTNAISVDVVP